MADIWGLESAVPDAARSLLVEDRANGLAVADTQVGAGDADRVGRHAGGVVLVLQQDRGRKGADKGTAANRRSRGRTVAAHLAELDLSLRRSGAGDVQVAGASGAEDQAGRLVQAAAVGRDKDVEERPGAAVVAQDVVGAAAADKQV